MMVHKWHTEKIPIIPNDTLHNDIEIILKDMSFVQLSSWKCTLLHLWPDIASTLTTFNKHTKQLVDQQLTTYQNFTNSSNIDCFTQYFH